ncbi:MAG: roadblock/LC7 domain-containing protein [Gemmatimonadaceae bacterium]|nr:roadblock/LC7 domain-containing protein [Gemmatimonadaceae bacterium]
MTAGAPSWTFTEDDFGAITGSMRRFLDDTNSMCAMLVDKSGQLVTTVGSAPGLDPTTFATLTAADFGANDQLARILGETDFTTLFHQGERESVFVADVARRLILVVIFDSRTSVGLVKLKLKPQVEELTALLDVAMSRSRLGVPQQEKLLHGAEQEIDDLFQW